MESANGNERSSDNEVDFEYVSRKNRTRKGKNRRIIIAPAINPSNESNVVNDLVDENGNNDTEDGEESNDDAAQEPESTESIADAVRFANNDMSTDRKLIRYNYITIAEKTFFTSCSENDDDGTTTDGVTLTVAEIKKLFNDKALSKDSRFYELEKFRLKLLIIFNQEKIDGFEPRYGTKMDVNSLNETFINFGFDVIEYKDLTKDEMIQVLETFKTTNFTDYGCVAVAILTHGSYNDLLRAKDQAYSETEIVRYFNVHDNPTLVSKPKVLFIQACRGTSCLPGVAVPQSSRIRRDWGEDERECYTLPIMSDLLIVHSSYVGETSTRDELHGSWFIQTLCRKINELAASQDLESILTEVKREVAAELSWETYNRRTRVIDTYKQMPTVTSTLIRKLFLLNFDVEVPETYLDYSAPGPSRNTSDFGSSAPVLVRYGPCNCFLDHLNYIRDCLVHFSEKNPEDVAARTFLEFSRMFPDESTFYAYNMEMTKAICRHFCENESSFSFFKFLYLLNDMSE